MVEKGSFERLSSVRQRKLLFSPHVETRVLLAMKGEEKEHLAETPSERRERGSRGMEALRSCKSETVFESRRQAAEDGEFKNERQGTCPSGAIEDSLSHQSNRWSKPCASC